MQTAPVQTQPAEPVSQPEFGLVIEDPATTQAPAQPAVQPTTVAQPVMQTAPVQQTVQAPQPAPVQQPLPEPEFGLVIPDPSANQQQ